MPIGEDIPMLIPISIILTVIVLFLFSVFITISEKNDIVRMSQVSLDVADRVININFTDGFGNINSSIYNRIGVNSSNKNWALLGINVNYKMKINISDSVNGRYWCWKNTNAGPEDNSITNSIPVMLVNETHKDLGKVTVIVSK